MIFQHRIGTIYMKELVAILRDRRTLIAMILVPIVLYPVLMLGSIQAVSFQSDSVETERLAIGVEDEQRGALLRRLIDRDTELLRRQREAFDASPDDHREPPAPLAKVNIFALGSKDEIDRRIRERTIHAGVLFDSPALVDSLDAQNTITIAVDEEDIRGLSARNRLSNMFARTNDRVVDARLKARNLPKTMLTPFIVNTVDLSSPPSILGQILPLILILMTITGAIYPAIDLTAGERERGTLESLMVCPVPVIDLIVGKFLVVTTVAIMGAALNLASVTATVYFGGFDRVISTTGGSIPFAKMGMILACLIPFAVLMSSIMIAVCSFARTFKEAQNYVTPVILAVLIPGGIAALPATQLEGIMLVMPVGNMVLLARDLLLGAALPAAKIATVLLSTTLYAAAAVAAAASVFGQESVVFSDSGSLRMLLSRRSFKPAATPPVAMGLLLVAVMFPLWFFIQVAFSPGPGEDASGLLFATGWMMPSVFVLLPLVLLAYTKVRWSTALCLRMPSPRFLLAGLLVGGSAWVPSFELNSFLQSILGTSEAAVQSAEAMALAMAALPTSTAIVLIAIVPAFSEEILFRGFLLGSLRRTGRKWLAILVSASIFGVFHFLIFKFPVTAAMGIVLAFLCWQSRSILPGMIAHFLHNSMGVLSVIHPEWLSRIGIDENQTGTHLPMNVLIVGGLLFVTGIILCVRGTTDSATCEST